MPCMVRSTAPHLCRLLAALQRRQCFEGLDRCCLICLQHVWIAASRTECRPLSPAGAGDLGSALRHRAMAAKICRGCGLSSECAGSNSHRRNGSELSEPKSLVLSRASGISSSTSSRCGSSVVSHAGECGIVHVPNDRYAARSVPL
jgi:hypothetical protein